MKLKIYLVDCFLKLMDLFFPETFRLGPDFSKETPESIREFNETSSMALLFRFPRLEGRIGIEMGRNSSNFSTEEELTLSNGFIKVGEGRGVKVGGKSFFEEIKVILSKELGPEFKEFKGRTTEEFEEVDC